MKKKKSFQCFKCAHHRYQGKSGLVPGLNGLFVWGLKSIPLPFQASIGPATIWHAQPQQSQGLGGLKKNARISFYCRDIIHSWEGSKVHASTYVIRVKQSGMQNPSQIASAEASGGRTKEWRRKKNAFFRMHSGSLHPLEREAGAGGSPLSALPWAAWTEIKLCRFHSEFPLLLARVTCLWVRLSNNNASSIAKTCLQHTPASPGVHTDFHNNSIRCH